MAAEIVGEGIKQRVRAPWRRRMRGGDRMRKGQTNAWGVRPVRSAVLGCGGRGTLGGVIEVSLRKG